MSILLLASESTVIEKRSFDVIESIEEKPEISAEATSSQLIRNKF